MATSLCCFSTGRRDRTGTLRCHQHLFRTAASVKSDARPRRPAGRRVDAVTLRICKRAPHSVHDCGLRQNDRARSLSGASAWNEGPVGTCFAAPALANKGRETWAIQEWLGASINHAHGGLYAMARIGSGISGGSESSDYFLTNGFASVSGGHGRS